ncbi:hypothetical protein C7W93_11410 [Glaciimonas sp. PCH181]|nr:hypothetical protein C7W93_11410 [Glaciimonas sp. PCH181]
MQRLQRSVILGKLFNLKKWLTVQEAARRLSNVCGSEITEADVLCLALDGHLKLSVNFVNHTLAECGAWSTAKKAVAKMLSGRSFRMKW